MDILLESIDAPHIVNVPQPTKNKLEMECTQVQSSHQILRDIHCDWPRLHYAH
jgi:hypothetical protein